MNKVTTIFPKDCEIVEEKSIDDGECIYVEVKGDPAAERYPLKMRDDASGVSYAALVKAGLVADDGDDEFDINECDGMDEMEW